MEEVVGSIRTRSTNLSTSYRHRCFPLGSKFLEPCAACGFIQDFQTSIKLLSSQRLSLQARGLARALQRLRF